MSVKPVDIFTVGAQLHKNTIVPAGEPCSRTVIGRAYYAAYHAVREAVRTSYGLPTADIEHYHLRKTFAQSLDPEVADIGIRLASLWAKRRVADYEIGNSVSAIEAVLMLAH